MIDKFVYKADVSIRERFVHLRTDNQENHEIHSDHGMEASEVIIIVCCVLIFICLITGAILTHRWIKNEIATKKKAMQIQHEAMVTHNDESEEIEIVPPSIYNLN